LSLGGSPESRAITGAWIARGRKPVPPPSQEWRGFSVPGTAGAPYGRGTQFYVLGSAAALPVEQLKGKEYDSGIERSVVHTSAKLFSARNSLLRAGLSPESIRISESEAAKMRPKGAVTTRPPEGPFRLVPQGEGTFTFETVTHDLEVSWDKSVEAGAEYLTTFVDRALDDATEFWHTESDLVTETVGAVEGVSGWLEITVDRPFKEFAATLGQSPAEAAVTAGVSTDLILAPITGPLDKAESFIEAAGIILGLLTGGHALVLACLKLLVHNEGKRLAVHVAVKAFGGSWTDRRRSALPQAGRHNPRVPSDAQRTAPEQAPISPLLHYPARHDVPGPEQVPVRPAAPVTRRRPTPQEALWQDLTLAPKPPTGSGAAGPAPATTAWKHRRTPPVVSLGSGTAVDMPRVRRSRRLSRGEHGIRNVGGVGFGTSSGSRNSQAACQHPGCLTGRCVPPGCLPCLCRCGVCHLYRQSE
jgi:hypothetical protein